MAKVIILTFDQFTDKKTKVKFSPHKVTRNGHAVFLGVATVSDEFAREHYHGRPNFEVQYDEQDQETLLQVGQTNEPSNDEKTEAPKIETTEPKRDAPPAPSEPTVDETTANVEVAPVTPLDEGSKWYTADELNALTVEKLKAVAEAEQIDVSKCKLKDEFINTILAAGEE